MEDLNKAGYVSWSLDNEIEFDDEGNENVIGEYVLIDLVMVNPDFRGQGYASKLIENAISEIKAKHPGMTIKLYALPKEKDIDLDRLVSLYEKCGFSQCKGHYETDGVFMEL